MSTGKPIISETVESMLEKLGATLTAELFAELEAINAPLAQEAAKHEEEARTLRQSYDALRPRVEAKQRILAGEVDKAISEGKDADAEAKRKESTALEQNLRDTVDKAEACECRAQELKAEQRQNYRAVFERAYPEIRQRTVSAEIALVQMLDEVWGGLQRYCGESGLAAVHTPPFVGLRHRLDLTPREHGAEKIYFERLVEWFGTAAK